MNIKRRKIISIALLAIAATMALSVSTFPKPAAGDNNTGGEVWVTAQTSSQILILHPRSMLDGGSFETIQLPANAHPHITTFSPDGNFAYVSDMGNGQMTVIRAQDRQIVASLNIAPTLTHQAKASPDGTLLLVANIANKTLFKVAADEASSSWTVTGSLSLASISSAPVCTIFRDDSLRAYVSLLPSGIAIVDVQTMTLLGTLPTDGFIACGMIKSQDGQTIFIASSGGGGHLYQLDTTTDALFDTGHTLGAGSWHSFNINPTKTVGYGSSPAVDQLQIINLSAGTATPLALDPTPGVGNDQPDAIAVQGNTVYVTLRFAGKLAIIDSQKLRVQYITLEPPATSVNPANCMGCAIHGVTIRPEPTTSSVIKNTPSDLSIQGKAVFASASISSSHVNIDTQQSTVGTSDIKPVSTPSSTLPSCEGCCCCYDT